jgi:hypothetical protein
MVCEEKRFKRTANVEDLAIRENQKANATEATGLFHGLF